MKNTYVVDLNVVMSAQTLMDDKGEESEVALRLLTELIARCHSLVTCSELYSQYSRLADTLTRSGKAQGLSIFGLARSAMAVSRKWIYVQKPSAVEGDEGVPEDDRGLVRLAVAARAHIVTTDGRLRTALRRTGLLRAHSLLALDLTEALQHISQD